MAFFQSSVRVVAADASGPVEEGVGAVEIDVDLDPRRDEMRPHRAFRNLQFQRAVGHAIVVADLALLLHAQDLVEVDAGNGREGRAFAGRLRKKAPIGSLDAQLRERPADLGGMAAVDLAGLGLEGFGGRAESGTRGLGGPSRVATSKWSRSRLYSTSSTATVRPDRR
jgi:hypothetical protein